MHIHSTFSAGAHTIEQNVAHAAALGLERICCVDHVRRDTDWLPTFVDTVRRADAASSLHVHAGLKAKILDEDGTLDAPDDLAGAEYLYAADQQFPLGAHCYSAREIRHRLHFGEETPMSLISALTRALMRTLDRYKNVVIAHLFSSLRRVRIAEEEVPLAQLEALADRARARGAMIEIDERWRCPSPRTVAVFREAGVPVLLSTDSRRKETIGRYDYVLQVLRALGPLV